MNLNEGYIYFNCIYLKNITWKISESIWTIWALTFSFYSPRIFDFFYSSFSKIGVNENHTHYYKCLKPSISYVFIEKKIYLYLREFRYILEFFFLTLFFNSANPLIWIIGFTFIVITLLAKSLKNYVWHSIHYKIFGFGGCYNCEKFYTSVVWGLRSLFIKLTESLAMFSVKLTNSVCEICWSLQIKNHVKSSNSLAKA